MKPHKIIHKYYVSKRDTHRRLGNAAFIYVFLTLFVAIVFSLQAKADDRSKTEADGGCIDCALQSLKLIVGPEGQMKDFKAINTAIFSNDPSGQTFIDPRAPLDRSSSIYKQLNAIGLVEVKAEILSKPPNSTDVVSSNTKSKDGKDSFYGTGFLINDCLVLTSNHVVNDDLPSDKVKNRQITFFAGQSQDSSKPFAEKSDGEVVAQGSYQGAGDKNVNNDWAIIKLSKPIGKTLGHIGPVLADSHTAMHIPVSAAAFYSDKTNGSQLWGQKKCEIKSEDPLNNNAWLTDCAVLAGTSGSPILAQNPETKQFFAIGLVQSAAKDKSGKFYGKENQYEYQKSNTATPLFKAFTPDELKKIIDSNRCDAVAT